MLDLKFILQHPEMVAQNAKNRFKNVDISLLQRLAQQRSDCMKSLEDIRARMNINADRVKNASQDERQEFIREGQELKVQAKDWEGRLREFEEELHLELVRYPNMLREDVPIGKDDGENEELRRVGEPPSFDFVPKDHMELGESLGMIDSDRASKVSGSRFAYLKGDLVMVELALVQYALTELMKEGFTPVLPPHIISTEAMSAMGYLQHGGEEEVYHLKNDDAVLIGTSEQSIGPMHMDEILDADQLPLRYVGFSPCYRREAGSHGKDVKGILRMHQFDKVEMFSFTTPENSDKEHTFLLSMQERMMQGLGLPYRVVRLCSGDIGAPSARTYDIETWMPGQQKYRETHSTSNTTDFQTRRLKIRYKTKDGTNELAHALNGTMFAIGRMLIALLENNQRADGSVRIPEVLHKWVGKEELRKKG